jgi:hypothetical protein
MKYIGKTVNDRSHNNEKQIVLVRTIKLYLDMRKKWHL